MAEEKKPDGNPPEPKLFAGKFKTPEELEAEFVKNQKLVTELNEKNARTEELLNAMLAGSPPAAPAKPPEETSGTKVSDYSRIVEDPNGVGKKIVEDAVAAAEERIVKRYQTMTQIQEQQKRLHDQFYAENPDLVEHKLIVGAISAQVEAEMPGKPVGEILKESAKRAKEYLIKLKGGAGPGAGAPPEGGGGGEPPAPSAPAKPQETSTEAYLKERAEAQKFKIKT